MYYSGSPKPNVLTKKILGDSRYMTQDGLSIRPLTCVQTSTPVEIKHSAKREAVDFLGRPRKNENEYYQPQRKHQKSPLILTKISHEAKVYSGPLSSHKSSHVYNTVMVNNDMTIDSKARAAMKQDFLGRSYYEIPVKVQQRPVFYPPVPSVGGKSPKRNFISEEKRLFLEDNNANIEVENTADSTPLTDVKEPENISLDETKSEDVSFREIKDKPSSPSLHGGEQQDSASLSEKMVSPLKSRLDQLVSSFKETVGIESGHIDKNESDSPKKNSLDKIISSPKETVERESVSPKKRVSSFKETERSEKEHHDKNEEEKLSPRRGLKRRKESHSDSKKVTKIVIYADKSPEKAKENVGDNFTKPNKKPHQTPREDESVTSEPSYKSPLKESSYKSMEQSPKSTNSGEELNETSATMLETAENNSKAEVLLKTPQKEKIPKEGAISSFFQKVFPSLTSIMPDKSASKNRKIKANEKKGEAKRNDSILDEIIPCEEEYEIRPCIDESSGTLAARDD